VGLSNLSSLAAALYAKHRVFVSYHHDNDRFYRDEFERLFSDNSDVFISTSVQIGDIPAWLDSDTVRQKIRDDYLKDSTVTVVLVGTQTWQRRHVDWEISSSIRQTKLSSRSGLLGIILPTHPSYYSASGYDGGIVPPRLVDNHARGFAKIYNWTSNPSHIRQWIHEAFDRRTEIEPDNSYQHFVNNKTGDRWK
jgi:hypothetical protein